MSFSELAEVLMGYGFEVKEDGDVILISRGGRAMNLSVKVLKIPLSEFMMLVAHAGGLLKYVKV
jgi:hypothetical protein